jgi:hypothetical protein
LSKPFSSLWITIQYLAIQNDVEKRSDLAKTVLNAVVKRNGEADVTYQMLGHLDGEFRQTIFEASKRSILDYLDPSSTLPASSPAMLMKYIDIVKYTAHDINEQNNDEVVIQIIAKLRFATQRLCEELMSLGDGSAINEL